MVSEKIKLSLELRWSSPVFFFQKCLFFPNQICPGTSLFFILLLKKGKNKINLIRTQNWPLQSTPCQLDHSPSSTASIWLRKTRVWSMLMLDHGLIDDPLDLSLYMIRFSLAQLLMVWLSPTSTKVCPFTS